MDPSDLEAGQIPTGPRAHRRLSSASTSSSTARQANGSTQPLSPAQLHHAVPTGPKNMRTQANGHSMSVSPASSPTNVSFAGAGPSSPSALSASSSSGKPSYAPSAPRAMLSQPSRSNSLLQGTSSNLAGARRSITTSGGTGMNSNSNNISSQRSAGPPVMSISLSSKARAPEGRSNGETMMVNGRPAYVSSVASTSKPSASSRASAAASSSYSHYKPSAREAEALARRAFSSDSNPSTRPKEPAQPPPPPPGSSTVTRTGPPPPPKMVVKLGANLKGNLKLAKPVFAVKAGPRGSARDVAASHNPLEKLGSEELKELEEVARKQREKSQPSVRPAASSSRGFKPYLPEHLEADELPVRIPDGTPEEIIAAAKAAAEKARAAAFLSHPPMARNALHTITAKPYLPPPLTLSAAQYNTNEHEDGEVTPSPAAAILLQRLQEVPGNAPVEASASRLTQTTVQAKPLQAVKSEEPGTPPARARSLPRDVPPPPSPSQQTPPPPPSESRRRSIPPPPPPISSIQANKYQATSEPGTPPPRRPSLPQSIPLPPPPEPKSEPPAPPPPVAAANPRAKEHLAGPGPEPGTPPPRKTSFPKIDPPPPPPTPKSERPAGPPPPLRIQLKKPLTKLEPGTPPPRKTSFPSNVFSAARAPPPPEPKNEPPAPPPPTSLGPSGEHPTAPEPGTPPAREISLPRSISIPLPAPGSQVALHTARTALQTSQPDVQLKPELVPESVAQANGTQDPAPPVPTLTEAPKSKSYFLTYDPDLDKSDKKSSKPIKRFEGEGIERPVKDPRLSRHDYRDLLAKSRRQRPIRRVEPVVYDYDQYSTCPPPPMPATSVLVTGLTALTTIEKVITSLSAYGRIVEKDLKTDPKTGGSLRICWIRYADEVERIVWTAKGKEKRKAVPGGQDGHYSALEAVKKLNGAKVVPLSGADGKVKVELDWDGSLCKKAVLDEMERRHPKPQPKPPPEPSPAHTAAYAPSSSSTPYHGSSASPVRQPSQSLQPAVQLTHSLPPRPVLAAEIARGSLRTQNPLSKPPVNGSARLIANSWTPQAALPNPPSKPLPVSPARAAAAKGPYRLPTSATLKQSPGGQRLSDPKGKSRYSDEESDSESDMDSEDERRRAEDDKVYFPRNTRQVVGSYASNKAPPARSEIDPALAQKKDVLRQLCRQEHAYVVLAKADLAAFREKGLDVTEGAVRGMLGKSNPLQILSDAGNWYATFSTPNGAQACCKQHNGKSFLGVQINMTEEDPPTMDDIAAMQETKVVRDSPDSYRPSPQDVKIQRDGPDYYRPSSQREDTKIVRDGPDHYRPSSHQDSRAADDALVREARNIIARDLEDAFARDIQREISDRISHRWDHKTEKAADSARLRKPSSRSASPIRPQAPARMAQQTPLGSSQSPIHAPLTSHILSHPSANPALSLSTSKGATKLPSFARRKEVPVQEPAWGEAAQHESSASKPVPIITQPSPSSEGRAKSDTVSVTLREDRAASVTSELSELSELNEEEPEIHQAVTPVSESEDDMPLRDLAKKGSKAKTEKQSKASKAIQHIVFTDSEESDGDFDRVVNSVVEKEGKKAKERKKTKKQKAKKAKAASPAPTDIVEILPELPTQPDPVSVEPDTHAVLVEPDIEPEEPVIVVVEAVEPATPVEPVETLEPVAIMESARTSMQSLVLIAPVVADTPFSLPTPAPTESSTTSGGKRELSIEIAEEVRKPVKRARLASSTPPAILPPAKKAPAPKANNRKKGAKGRKAAPKVAKAVSFADPASLGFDDKEDLYYLRLALQRNRAGEDILPDELPEPFENLGEPRHETNSARTEGYYRIPQAEKLSYLASRNQARVETGSSSIAVSRLARVNARHLASGLDKHKKATASDTDLLQFNQLRTRKKQMRFARSPIHDWGLYAMEHIPAGEMVIEYVGESIRQQVADKREKMYERQGIGSSYLFRVDDDGVIDATMKGNLGRLINHCCTPNCTARILSVGTSKKIVIFAKQAIYEGDEITYDYHFPIEDEKIPCLCGMSGCRGFLN